MGGVGGTYNLMGGGDTTSSSPVDQNGFLGSRAALPEASGTPTSEADFSTWLASIQQAVNGQQGVPMAAPTTDAGNPLVANPTTVTGFAHADYPAPPVTGIEHISGAAPAPPPVVDTTPKEFAAPTSFRPIWDVAAEVNHELGMKYAWQPEYGWQNNPERAREWLQMIADKGGDWRDNTTGKKAGYPYAYNIDPVGGMGQIYWPGDPARPK
jgi:hypothetical protein